MTAMSQHHDTCKVHILMSISKNDLCVALGMKLWTLHVWFSATRALWGLGSLEESFGKELKHCHVPLVQREPLQYDFSISEVYSAK